MKKIKIQAIINDDDTNILTGIDAKGFNMENLSSNFELLGILDNVFELLKEEIKEKIKIKGRLKKD